ncbi:MAG: hypothetical protein NDI77_06885 [Geobacteraceae bacterium]|nr:hypothetical protein [Geobacteraceae bacterium]
MNNRIVLLCTIVVFLAGCSSSSQPQSGEKDRGREETKKLEGASAVGYDGTAIRKNVDNTLNKNDDHNQDLDKAMKSDTEGQQKP